jgi:hypothetical protein
MSSYDASPCRVVLCNYGAKELGAVLWVHFCNGFPTYQKTKMKKKIQSTAHRNIVIDLARSSRIGWLPLLLPLEKSTSPCGGA